MKAFSLALIVIVLCIAMFLGDMGVITPDKANGWNWYGSFALVYCGFWFWRRYER